MKISIIGLGYVGLPLALAFAEKHVHVVGFDINKTRIRELGDGHDATHEVSADALAATTLKVTADPAQLEGTDVFIVAVPTPIDRDNRPDLSPIIKSSETIGQHLKKGAIVVYESTVYPGVTEDICGPILARTSGLARGEFKLGYSPERINPGDKTHTLPTIVKVVSGEDEATLNMLTALYGSIITAGVHRAPSIKVAEAAKVIENTQRDLNIALMNELALIFDRMNIRTMDVLAASRTKWNFLPYEPGLVGGHCISVDPYYLTTKAEELGYYPQVILAGRRINSGIGAFIAQKLVKLLIASGKQVKGARVAILGMAFKEDVPDLRNSRTADIYRELQQFGIQPLVHDPLADSAECLEEYGISLASWEDIANMDGIVYAVRHEKYRQSRLHEHLVADGVLIDVKSAVDPSSVPAGVTYWSL